MDGWRQVLAMTIVAGLAAITATRLLAPEPAPAPSVTPATVSPATAPVTNPEPTTTSAPADGRAGLEAMIADMYFVWFDGVHRRDMDTIELVAGADTVIRWAEGAFDSLAFTAPPTREAIAVRLKDVLLDRADCLVVSADVDFRAFIDTDTVHSTVDVYFPVGDGWGFATKYKYERELWLTDCDHLERR